MIKMSQKFTPIFEEHKQFLSQQVQKPEEVKVREIKIEEPVQVQKPEELKVREIKIEEALQLKKIVGYDFSNM